mmetsp:Transcript_120712/g.240394  ORF Transcript_120712/g.240394 Transcript_120712/m.240394 type:complete len:150 (-) Transcript_120712:199-648(-)
MALCFFGQRALRRPRLLATMGLGATALLVLPALLGHCFCACHQKVLFPLRTVASAEGNLGGDFWPHPWAEELAASDKGESITFDDVVDHFNTRREADGLEPLEPMSSPLVILEGIVDNAQLSGQSNMNKAQRIADGIQASSFLLSELTS